MADTKAHYVNPDSGKPAPDNPHLAGDSPIEIAILNLFWSDALQDFDWAKMFEYEWTGARITRVAVHNGLPCGSSRAKRIKDTLSWLHTEATTHRGVPATYSPTPPGHSDF